MMSTLAQYSGRLAKIEGSARSGKTEVLVQRCKLLIEEGVDAASILVVVSSESAAHRFIARLEHALDAAYKNQAARVVVSRALDVCTAILDTPETRAATGRVPRILNDSEYLFFIEDLKTLGQKNQRLSNMLLFFYAQWSSFEDEESWLIPGEESLVLDYAREVLGLYQAMLRHEVPFVCGKYLLSDAGKPHAQRFDYVFCDDYQNLSRAEQTCVCLCARKQLIVCGNASDATKVNTNYPYAKGFKHFERLRKSVDVFTLDTSFGIEQALHFEEMLDASKEIRYNYTKTHKIESTSTQALFIEWETPDEELLGLGSFIQSFCAHNPHATLDTIAIAVPSKRWGKLIQGALKKQGFATSTAGLNPSLGGDPRYAGHHDALTAYAQLCLVASPTDSLAWRVWTGLDDALTRSEAWKSLFKIAREEELSLYDVLKDAVENAAADARPVLKRDALKQAWKSGWQCIHECEDLKGMDLAEALGLSQSAVYDEVLSTLNGTEDAACIKARVQRSLTNPSFPEDPNHVAIALYENLCGLDYECLVMPGMVDGMIPFRDAFDETKDDAKRENVIANDRERLCSALTKGTKYFVASTFKQTDIETAERAKLKVKRITSLKGERTALLSPSSFFDEAGIAPSEFTKGANVEFENFFK